MNPIIVALDFDSKEKVHAFLANFKEPIFVKVGMELYYQEGPAIIQEIKALGHHIFLDLKLHDIPNTVKSAMKVLGRLGVDLVNVHAAGGYDMMVAAKQGLLEGAGENVAPKLIAVTQLTSSTEAVVREEQLVSVSLEQSVVHYAQLAKKAGLDGVVCSAHEAQTLRTHIGEDFLLVTPGIRLADDAAHDQKRIATPNAAKKSGVSHIVVGRTITQATNHKEAFDRVLTNWEA